MKLYTKKGDQGQCSLSGGTRIDKSSDLLEAYGTIDELNATIGLILADMQNETLTTIQHRLFAVGGMLATEINLWEKYWGNIDLEKYTRELEAEIDQLSEQLDPMKGFILPQGNRLIAQTHVCRTVCRRAERRIARLTDQEPAYLPLLKYTNRLSDFLFVLARHEHQTTRSPEINWNSAR
ncbi:cob(I)yrinic acid a,c-diamide adenosyltransferase [Bacteroidales bacterium OttesenSCG-928-B11]|nr:cob(I)yrinic acid a,c-diamide adenosyltransferase [Bacteroidales bacterium OttesenSCG-928-C03]MDL2313329.1 cob(I)yrinic acid a,c-diamide adenosyltransferase [Bacteroidales bacterium OttesenSCG-928-B11]MDL2326779.1 cob(I)yrinic acid a,c-diamide adenosyltransferase [Bacteroidales bacterium OttesenSCG-928-A14]